MATKQRIVWGAKTQWAEAGGSLVDIPEVKGLAVPVPSVEYQDATSLDSANGYREFVAGLKDAGEISLPCGYTSGGYEAAYGYFMSGTLLDFSTVLPVETGQDTGDEFAFQGYVTPEMETNNVGDIIGMSLNIRVSGKPTWTKGTDTV